MLLDTVRSRCSRLRLGQLGVDAVAVIPRRRPEIDKRAAPLGRRGGRRSRPADGVERSRGDPRGGRRAAAVGVGGARRAGAAGWCPGLRRGGRARSGAGRGPAGAARAVADAGLVAARRRGGRGRRLRAASPTPTSMARSAIRPRPGASRAAGGRSPRSTRRSTRWSGTRVRRQWPTGWRCRI